jgi:hypothetical protein
LFILYALVLGLSLGLLSGGHVRGLSRLQFRWSGLILVGLLVQLALFSTPVTDHIGDLGPPIYALSTAAVLVAVVRNSATTGIPIVAVGAASNLVAIVANGGYMPADPHALAAIGRGLGTGYSNSTLAAEPAVRLLTDIFALPTWLPFTNIFSAGDVLIGLGVAVVIIAAMRSPAVGPSTGSGA